MDEGIGVGVAVGMGVAVAVAMGGVVAAAVAAGDIGSAASLPADVPPSDVPRIPTIAATRVTNAATRPKKAVQKEVPFQLAGISQMGASIHRAHENRVRTDDRKRCLQVLQPPSKLELHRPPSVTRRGSE
jgi:hypothetical protein